MLHGKRSRYGTLALLAKFEKIAEYHIGGLALLGGKLKLPIISADFEPKTLTFQN